MAATTATIDWTQFQTAISNAMAQGFAQQTPAQQAPVPGAQAPKKSSLAKPEEFDGKGAHYEKFIRQVELYLLANQHLFPDDDTKILFVLSYMTEGLADQWAQNFIGAKKLAAGNNVLTLGTWTDFKKALDASFIDPNRKRNAQAALEGLRQGRMTAEEFFTQFDQTRRTAGYDTGYDEMLIALLEKALNPGLVRDL
jgi:hypothetical protein